MRGERERRNEFYLPEFRIGDIVKKMKQYRESEGGKEREREKERETLTHTERQTHIETIEKNG